MQTFSFIVNIFGAITLVIFSMAVIYVFSTQHGYLRPALVVLAVIASVGAAIVVLAPELVFNNPYLPTFCKLPHMPINNK